MNLTNPTKQNLIKYLENYSFYFTSVNQDIPIALYYIKSTDKFCFVSQGFVRKSRYTYKEVMNKFFTSSWELEIEKRF